MFEQTLCDIWNQVENLDWEPGISEDKQSHQMIFTSQELFLIYSYYKVHIKYWCCTVEA